MIHIICINGRFFFLPSLIIIFFLIKEDKERKKIIKYLTHKSKYYYRSCKQILIFISLESIRENKWINLWSWLELTSNVCNEWMPYHFFFFMIEEKLLLSFRMIYYFNLKILRVRYKPSLKDWYFQSSSISIVTSSLLSNAFYELFCSSLNISTLGLYLHTLIYISFYSSRVVIIYF